MIDPASPEPPLPTPEQIRHRLSELATEANFLRSLLRLLERRQRRAQQARVTIRTMAEVAYGH